MQAYLKATKVCCALLALSVGISTQSVAAEPVDQLGEAIRELRSDVNELRISNVKLIQQNLDLRSDLDGLRGDFEAHGRRRGLQTDDAALSCINTTISDAKNIYFDGCNVHIRGGTAGTEETNGRGNLIVGYNRQPPVRDTPRPDIPCKYTEAARKIPKSERRRLEKGSSKRAPRAQRPQRRRLQSEGDSPDRTGSHNIIEGTDMNTPATVALLRATKTGSTGRTPLRSVVKIMRLRRS